jgi:hypothetical protein
VGNEISGKQSGKKFCGSLIFHISFLICHLSAPGAFATTMKNEGRAIDEHVSAQINTDGVSG